MKKHFLVNGIIHQGYTMGWDYFSSESAVFFLVQQRIFFLSQQAREIPQLLERKIHLKCNSSSPGKKKYPSPRLIKANEWKLNFTPSLHTFVPELSSNFIHLIARKSFFSLFL